MIDSWNITIPELTGDEPRRAYIYLPDSWEMDPDLRYPVLYMFDGHNVFFDEDATYGKSWGMGEYLDATQTQIIVAAVECNHHPDNGRLSEYSPWSFYNGGIGRVVGRGRTTMEWLVHSFKRSIDEEFRTLPDRLHTFIAGSSMGGLMTLYAVMEYNRYFSRGAALSPSLWVAPQKVDTLIRTARISPGTVLYMDYGSREIGNHAQTFKLLGRTAAGLLDRRVLLDFRIVPAGDHSEASWERQIPFFMSTLLYGQED